RAAARRALDGQARQMEACRETWGVTFLDHLRRDLRTGVRGWRRTPGLWALATITLGVGLGANATIFSVVDVIYHHPLSGLDPERYTVLEAFQEKRNRRGNSLEDFLAWKQAGIFPIMAATQGVERVLIGAGEPQRIRGLSISEEFFSLFPGTPAMGRYPSQAEFRGIGNKVLVLSYSAWQVRFGGRQDVIGQTVRLDDATYTVIGVTPEPFWFSDSTARFWTPMELKPGAGSATERSYQVIARLPEGSTRARAESDLKPVAEELARRFPASHAGWRVRAKSLFEAFYGPEADAAVWILFVVSGGVLLVCCANVTNLLLTRGLTLRREMSVRAALGAGRWRLFCQSMSEGMLLAVPAALMGLAATQAVSTLLFHSMQLPFPIPANFLDGRVLAVNFAAAVLSVFLFGLYPAMLASRTNASLDTGGRRSTFPIGARRFSRVLLLSQAGGGLALVIVALVGVEGFRRIMALDVGYERANVVRVRLNPAEGRYGSEQDYQRFYRRLALHLESARLESFGFVSVIPSLLWGDGAPVAVTTAAQRQFTQDQTTARYLTATAGALRALRLPIKAGRPIEESDTAETERVAVVNQKLCDQLFQGRDPLTESLIVDELGPEPFRVVGVYANLLPSNVKAPPAPQFWVSQWQVPSRGSFLVARATDKAGAMDAIRRSVRAVDRDVPVDMRSLEADVEDDYRSSVVLTRLVAALAALTLFLAGGGVFAVLSQSVTQRMPEIGIRLALGATPGSLQRLIIGSGLRAVGVGALVGIAGGVALGKMLAAQITRIDPVDAEVLIPAVAAFLVVAAVACLAPARRIGAAVPMSLLRQGE
ncbi:MAG: ABC transporter permease, partial [Bryobacterales bacterium]|nr:ABC transporter permease [Bryobacterales bacterium]